MCEQFSVWAEKTRNKKIVTKFSYILCMYKNESFTRGKKVYGQKLICRIYKWFVRTWHTWGLFSISQGFEITLIAIKLEHIFLGTIPCFIAYNIYFNSRQ